MDWKKNVVWVWKEQTVHSRCNHKDKDCEFHKNKLKFIIQKIESKFKTKNVKKIQTCRYEDCFFDGTNIFVSYCDTKSYKSCRCPPKTCELIKMTIQESFTWLHCCLCYGGSKEHYQLKDILQIYMKTKQTFKDEDDLQEIFNQFEEQEAKKQRKLKMWNRH